MPRPWTCILVACLPFGALAQSGAPASPPPSPPPSNLQGGWDSGAANEQAEQWRVRNSIHPGDAALQWNWFQSTYNALNSGNNAVLGPGGRRELATIADDIRVAAPNSFERHLADYYVAFPAPGAFAELEAAHRMAPERPELIAPMLSLCMRNGDAPGVQRWSAQLQQRGGLSPALQAVAADVLLSIPADAILFTNGDMDTQPVVVRQLLGGDKPGVLTVDRRLLADAGYRSRVWRQAGASGTVPGDGPVFAEGLLKATQRPVYFALSLDRSWLQAFAGRLNAVGAVFRVGSPAAGDQPALERAWATMGKPMDAGPLSRNYLVPGTLLLARAQHSGDAAQAARLADELRRMAKATGATAELKRLGILQP